MSAKLSSLDLARVELGSAMVALISSENELESADSVVAKKGKDSEGRAKKHKRRSQTKSSERMVEDETLIACRCLQLQVVQKIEDNGVS